LLYGRVVVVVMGANESQLRFKHICYILHDIHYTASAGEIARLSRHILSDQLESQDKEKEELIFDNDFKDKVWDFTAICDGLRSSLNACVLLTEETFFNGECLVELCVSVMEGVNIIPVVLHGRGVAQFKIPSDKKEYLMEYPLKLSEETVKFLHHHNLLVQDCMSAINDLLDKITHVFDASASLETRMSQVEDIAQLFALEASSAERTLLNDDQHQYPLPVYLIPDREEIIQQESEALLVGTRHALSTIYSGSGIHFDGASSESKARQKLTKLASLKSQSSWAQMLSGSSSSRKSERAPSGRSSLRCRSMNSSSTGSLLRTKSRKKRKAVMVGLDGAGKTSLLFALKTRHGFQATDPTLGFNLETVPFGKVDLRIWDLSGKKEFRRTWKQFLEDSHAVIFVVDSSNRQRLDEACQEFARLKKDLKNEGIVSRKIKIPILIFANRQNSLQTGSVSLTEISIRMRLHSLSEHNWFIQSCNSMNMDGIFEGLEWLTSKLLQPIPTESP